MTRVIRKSASLSENEVKSSFTVRCTLHHGFSHQQFFQLPAKDYIFIEPCDTLKHSRQNDFWLLRVAKMGSN